MAEGATALASMQRLVEERTQQASSAQQALMQAQQDQASLTARLRTAQDQAALRSAGLTLWCPHLRRYHNMCLFKAHNPILDN